MKWAITGPDFPFIRPGMPLSGYSHASDAFGGKPLPTGLQRVPAHAWVDVDGNTDAFEDSIWMPSFSATLSLLWLPDRD